MIAIEGGSFARRCAVLVLLALVLATCRAETVRAAGSHQEFFASPEDAVQTLVAALKANDTKALLSVLGDDKAVLQTGKDDWPFPIPLMKSAAGWRFDTAAGKEEILDRRIGRNELSTIQSCLAYVDAQREYYQRDPDHDSLLQYARKIASTPGKRDGLYWDTKPGEEESPLGPAFARARGEGYTVKRGKPVPYHGYYYHILTAQGPAAAGGAYSYLAHGKMMGGFALVAYPAQYGNSGVMTFIVNQDGVVFQKDLGPHSAATAKGMKTFNPDTGWKQVEAADHGNAG